MPIGVIINSAALALGGVAGHLAKNRLSEDLKDTLNMIMGLCALCMGINSVVLLKNLPPVVMAVIVGTLMGLILKIGFGIQKGCGLVLNKVMKDVSPDVSDLMLTAVVLFCSSATGIYGSLDAGMTGNHSILITKAVLDFFTAMIFACKLGLSASFIAIPQFVVFLGLFGLAKVIVPLTTDMMVADFKACGGFLLVATGLRIMKLKSFPVADMIPAMVIVMPLSYIWTSWLLPLLG